MTSRRRELLRQVLWLVAAVLVVHGTAIAVWALAGLRTAGPTARLVFTAAWTIATMIVVVVGLVRVRRARTPIR